MRIKIFFFSFIISSYYSDEFYHNAAVVDESDCN